MMSHAVAVSHYPKSRGGARWVFKGRGNVRDSTVIIYTTVRNTQLLSLFVELRLVSMCLWMYDMVAAPSVMITGCPTFVAVSTAFDSGIRPSTSSPSSSCISVKDNMSALSARTGSAESKQTKETESSQHGRAEKKKKEPVDDGCQPHRCLFLPTRQGQTVLFKVVFCRMRRLD